MQDKWYNDSFVRLENRINYSNKLLEEILKVLAKGANIEVNLPSGPQTPSPTGSAILPNRNDFSSGQRVVKVAGTAIQLPSFKIPNGYALSIIAKPTNVGNVYIGSSKTDAEGSNNFSALTPGSAVSLHIANPNLIWINVDNNNDGISWIVEV